MSTPTNVTLTPDVPDPIRDKNVALYNSIRNSSENLSFNVYSTFLTALFCNSPKVFAQLEGRIDKLDFQLLFARASELKTTSFECLAGTRAYESLRRATDVFVSALAAPPETCGCFRPEPGKVPPRKGPIKEAMEVVADEMKDQAVDAADVARRYSPRAFTAKDLQAAIDQLLAGSADLPSPQPGDNENPLLPIMRRLRHNLRGIPAKDSPQDDCSGVFGWRLECPPFLELIWNYWMEQGMLVQGINAVALRFQNQRRGAVDPLQRMDLTWLRPLNGLLWGYIQAEPDRLTVVRRAYEYDHHYGLRLTGRSVPPLNPADSRPRFLEAFHHLLAEATKYYRLSMNTLVRPDTFPVLNALKELHLVLSEGAANQFGDLPATARQEMLIQQWLIGRPEMRDFLGGRPGVVYPEAWMGHMDTLRQAFGWNEASIRHYYDLATFGERILLSVRWGDWSTTTDDFYAQSWLTFWRSEIQSYAHAYRTVTGVDLNTDQVRTVNPQLFAAQPTELIMQRRAIPAAAAARAR